VAEGGRVGVQQQACQQPLHPGALGVQLGGVAAADGDVQADPKQPSVAAGQPSGQPAGVLGGGLGPEVGQAAVVGVKAP